MIVRHSEESDLHIEAVTAVSATLYYQTASKQYITFLRDENVGNPNDWRAWGDSLYSAWTRKGKSRPVAMNTVNALVTSVQQTNEVVQQFHLEQNYPNPFNPSTKIQFKVPSSEFVVLKVYDVLGREVRTLVNEELKAGSYETTFSAEGLASGVYLYRLQAGTSVQTKKLMLLR